MTATEELRRMLDERGVEYNDRDMFGKHVFHWGEPLHGVMFTDGGEWTELVVENATPEQAIDATLGRGTTTRTGKYRTKYGRSVPCCECCGYGIGDTRWHYCPSCGARVVDA